MSIYTYTNPNICFPQLKAEDRNKLSGEIAAFRVQEASDPNKDQEALIRYVNQLKLLGEVTLDGTFTIIDNEDKLISVLQPEDIIITSTLVNFSASFGGVLKTIERMPKDVTILSMFEACKLLTSDEWLTNLIPIVTNFERNYRSTKTKKSLNNSLTKKNYQGKSYKDIPEFEKFYYMYQTRELTKIELAKKINVSRPTLDKLIQEYKLSN